MRKFLIAAHGTFSSGIKSSLDIIIGKQEVMVIDAYVNDNHSIEDDLGKILDDLDENDQLIIFTDLMGGSITNQVLRSTKQKNVHVISGMNLPLLIDIILADEDKPLEEVIADAITRAKEQLVYVNALINKEHRK